METDSEPEGEVGTSRLWIIIFCSSLLALSIFWSVDKSIVYFLLGISVFSLFKILQGRFRASKPSQPDYKRPFEYQAPRQGPSFWQELREEFRKNSQTNNPAQKGKIFVALVAGFIGFMFLVAILGAIFGDDVADDLAYYYMAEDYYNNQQYDSAAYYYKLALVNDPENADLYFGIGNAFLNTDKTDSALIMYDEALARNPYHEQAQYNKGYIYFNRKNYRQAIDETKKIMSYNSEYTDAMLLIGDSFYNQSQLDSALNWYEGAYSRGYRSAILCHLMAYIYDVKGQSNTAINLYKEAVRQDSTIKAIYVRLGEMVPGEEGNRYRQKAAEMQ